MHSCYRCLEEAIAERCPLFRFDFEEEDDEFHYTREDPNRPIPSEDAATVPNRKTKQQRNIESLRRVRP